MFRTTLSWISLIHSTPITPYSFIPTSILSFHLCPGLPRDLIPSHSLTITCVLTPQLPHAPPISFSYQIFIVFWRSARETADFQLLQCELFPLWTPGTCIISTVVISTLPGPHNKPKWLIIVGTHCATGCHLQQFPLNHPRPWYKNNPYLWVARSATF